MLGKTKGFFNYLRDIPSYIWYVWGEWVVKHLFPKSFDVWFAAELKAIENIQTYLRDKELILNEQLEQSNKLLLKRKTKKKVKKNGPTKKYKK